MVPIVKILGTRRMTTGLMLDSLRHRQHRWMYLSYLTNNNYSRVDKILRSKIFHWLVNWLIWALPILPRKNLNKLNKVRLSRAVKLIKILILGLKFVNQLLKTIYWGIHSNNIQCRKVNLKITSPIWLKKIIWIKYWTSNKIWVF